MTRFFLKTPAGEFLVWKTVGGQELRYSFDTAALASAFAPGCVVVELPV